MVDNAFRQNCTLYGYRVIEIVRPLLVFVGGERDGDTVSISTNELKKFKGECTYGGSKYRMLRMTQKVLVLEAVQDVTDVREEA